MKVPSNTPWRVQYFGGTGGIWVIDSKGEKVAMISYNSQEEAMAVAELIAAAPSLLQSTRGLSSLTAHLLDK